MGQAIAFYTLSALILFFAVLVVSTKDTVHSVLFLVVLGAALGIIGVTALARANPNGYTIGLSSISTHSTAAFSAGGRPPARPGNDAA